MRRYLTLIISISLILALGLFCYGFAQEKSGGVAGREIIFGNKGLPYGFEAALPEVHGFITGQFWNAAPYIQNEYADASLQDGSHYGAGESTFDLHSAYIDIISEFTKEFLIEVEFEIYHSSGVDATGNVKAGSIRGLWHPDPKINISIGRQMVFLGSQEKVYYPTSRYRFFTWQDPLTEKFLRFTGWWDTGVAALGQIPIGDGDMFAEYGLMVSNGPGSETSKTATDAGSLLGLGTTKGVMKSSGYVYERFTNNLRQRLDNNDNKPISWRIGFSPIKELLFRVEGMQGKYDTNDDYDFNFLTSEIFFSRGKLDSIFGFGQLKFEAPRDTVSGYIWPGGEVKQMAWYLGAGYKILENKKGINFLQPAARISWIDPNSDVPSSVSQYEHYGTRNIYDIGLNYSPWAHVVFRSGYRWQKETKGPHINNNGFTMEAVFDF